MRISEVRLAWLGIYHFIFYLKNGNTALNAFFLHACSQTHIGLHANSGLQEVIAFSLLSQASERRRRQAETGRLVWRCAFSTVAEQKHRHSSQGRGATSDTRDRREHDVVRMRTVYVHKSRGDSDTHEHETWEYSIESEVNSFDLKRIPDIS